MKNLSKFTLKQLHYFTSLANNSSFGAAAKAVNISQPALSLQIKALEECFGGQLIERRQRGFVLTPLGQQVLECAEEILRQTEKLAAIAIDSGDQPAEPVRLGLIPTVAPYLLPKAFPALRKGFQDTEFAIREGRTSQLITDLYSDLVELAIVALPVGDGNLHSFPLFEEPFVVATSRDFAFPTDRKLAGCDLEGHNILLLEEGHCLRDQAIQACGINMNHALNQFGASSLATIVEMVANGFGLTLLPKMALEKEASDPRLKLYSMAPPGPGRKLGLVWRRSSPYGDFYSRVGEVIRNAST